MHIDIGVYIYIYISIYEFFNNNINDVFFILRTLKVSGADGIIRNNVVKKGVRTHKTKL